MATTGPSRVNPAASLQQGEQHTPAPHIPTPQLGTCGELQLIFFILFLFQLRNDPVLVMAALQESSGVERLLGSIRC